MRYLLSTAIIALGMTYVPAISALTATQFVEKETLVKNADGSETVVRSPADKVLPGEKIVYKLIYTNDKTEPATNLILTMPVPGEVIYLDNTATTEGATVSYSTDGRIFSPRDGVRVSDAQGNLRRANGSDISHIRWTVPGPVQAGSNGELIFKGLLK